MAAEGTGDLAIQRRQDNNSQHGTTVLLDVRLPYNIPRSLHSDYVRYSVLRAADRKRYFNVFLHFNFAP
jgi:hypothetical protein